MALRRRQIAGISAAVTTLLALLLVGCSGSTQPADGALTEQAQLTDEQQPGSTRGEAGPVDMSGEDGKVLGVPGEQGESKQFAADASSKRFALLFGNGAYRQGDALTSPKKDAGLMAHALQARGYHVLMGVDRDLHGMQEDIAAFAEMSRDAELRLFYFAGHGFELDSVNYLMPVDLPASIEKLGEQDVRNNALRLDQLVHELEQDAPVLVAVVDACRVPPTRGKGSDTGLRAEEAPEGTIIAFATSPGRAAMDSLRAYGIDEDNSPYTFFLADALQSPDVQSWDEVFMQAYNLVNNRTRGAQQPWMNSRVTQFPALGPLQGGSSRDAGGPLSLTIAPERRAAGRYWSNESRLASRLAIDRTYTENELQRMAKDGDTRAAIALATRLSEDKGRKREAITLLEPVAEGGNAAAQVDLGTALYDLAAEDRNGHDARYWWSLASAQGVGEARTKLAILDLKDADDDPSRALNELTSGMTEVMDVMQERSNAELRKALKDPR